LDIERGMSLRKRLNAATRTPYLQCEWDDLPGGSDAKAWIFTGDEMTKFEEPTAERIARSDGFVDIGDEKQGSKRYTYLDRSL